MEIFLKHQFFQKKRYWLNWHENGECPLHRHTRCLDSPWPIRKHSIYTNIHCVISLKKKNNHKSVLYYYCIIVCHFHILHIPVLKCQLVSFNIYSMILRHIRNRANQVLFKTEPAFHGAMNNCQKNKCQKILFKIFLKNKEIFKKSFSTFF